MNREKTKELASRLDRDAVVLDVGGGASPFPRADYVLDAIPLGKAGWHGDMVEGIPIRYTAQTWIQRDVCDRAPWPFPDKFFDFSICSHLLEDVRDPIWVCSELQRVSHAGYIEVPSRIIEQTLGVEHPRYAGFCHHRWLVSARGEVVEFRFKPHLLHTFRDAIVAEVGVWRQINPEYSVTMFEWQNRFEYYEVIEPGESQVAEELRAYALRARTLPDLIVNTDGPFMRKLRRQAYFSRLNFGFR